MGMKKLLTVSSWFAVVAGLVLIIGGVWGICFTYQNIAQENIITPADASIPGVPVRGPFTLKAQADIIRHHVLEMTKGQTYAEMSRQDPTRDIWVTATPLITALNLAILTYVFSGLIILLGCISVWTGVVFSSLRRHLK
jgi:hypothetical protein